MDSNTLEFVKKENIEALNQILEAYHAVEKIVCNIVVP